MKEKKEEYVTKERFEKMARYFLEEINRLKAQVGIIQQDSSSLNFFLYESGITKEYNKSDIDVLSGNKALEYEYYDECLLPHLKELYQENPASVPNDITEIGNLPEHILERVQAYSNTRPKGDYGYFMAWYKKNLPLIKEKV